MKKLNLLSVLMIAAFGLMTSCSDEAECQECHVAYDHVHDGETEEIEIPITAADGGEDFCGDELADVETEGYTRTIEETIVVHDGETDTVPAGSYPVHCEIHADGHDHD
tara:strand:- start:127 stop:453 length:327 start_codon:yes stop_codon:yes gene_type:complete